MLITIERILNQPIMSLQTGQPLAKIDTPIVNPNNLKIVAFYVSGPFIYTHEREAAMKAAVTPATPEEAPAEEPTQTAPETNTDEAGTTNDSNS
jgi:hypothetical protein